MQTFERAEALRSYLREMRTGGRTIGFVPTMGALHEGHLSLIRRARAESDVVAASIFVNPTQFGPSEDLARYPRDLERDSRVAADAGVDALFVPGVQEIYPGGAATFVEVPSLAARWEGAVRPGHFRGVATVCAILFEIVEPDRVYFGQKDYQQLTIIRRLVRDLHFPIEVVSMPTVREADGLALSSRNAYLSPEERRASTVLYRALAQAERQYGQGERSCPALESSMRVVIESEPLARLDYAAVTDPDTLEPLESISDRAVALIAARIGATRLIDNLLLGGGAGVQAIEGRGNA